MNASARGYIIVALIAAVFVMILNRFVSADLTQRNYEAFTEMVYSKAGEPFASNQAMPGGKTQQPIVEGTVVRGHMPLGFAAGADEALRAGRELVSPIAADDTAALERGAELYSVYCIVCHDAAGKGRGPVVMRGMLPPPSLTAARASDMADGEMFHILTFGQGNMASYAAQLGREERWQVISHVRALQGE
jgi:mono/diheme cytochrome c family protein